MLDKQQIRQLRALAHERKPIVIIGEKGLTSAVLAEIEAALRYHELIKVRVNAEDRLVRDEYIANMCQALSAELVQRIGHIATLFRRNSDKPRIAFE